MGAGPCPVPPAFVTRGFVDGLHGDPDDNGLPVEEAWPTLSSLAYRLVFSLS